MAYAYSTDEECFMGHADTVEGAIALAIEECDLEPGRTVWVGRIAEPNMKYLLPSADDVLEGMHERAYEEYGEHTESWMDGLTKAQTDDLDNMLRFAITDWMKRNNMEPKFYGIEDAQAHVITAAQVAPGHTDLMVAPEAIDEYLDAFPPQWEEQP